MRVCVCVYVCVCVCVCVCENFLNKVWGSLIWLKAIEFSKQEKKSMIDQSKVKLYFTRA
jgi:hypothetical protein